MFTRRESLLLAGASMLAMSPLSAFAQERPNPQPADWADPQFTQPFIDTDEWRDAPVRHRYLHGGFRGTNLLFSLYFPPSEAYQGRFFHYVNPTSGNERVGQRRQGGFSPIGFSIASGGYFIESNLGRLDAAAGEDGTLCGWRASAAVAKYARQRAIEMYGGGRPFGYMYGGSGGGFKTMSAMENTIGIWDGAVPFIIGSPMSLPNVYTVRQYALHLLQDKAVDVVDAIEPGGSGDMYAGLDADQRAALQEAHRFGFPPKSWAFHETLRGGAGGVGGDATYTADFWRSPGYLGANPPAWLARDRIQQRTRIRRVLSHDEVERLSPTPVDPTTSSAGDATPPTRIGLQLEAMPARNPQGGRIGVVSGAANGRNFTAGPRVGDVVIVTAMNPALTQGIAAGDEVELDNSAFLASLTFHRHQVPPSRDYVVWEQFRGPDGTPLFPQRPALLGPRIAAQGAGSIQTGRFNGKMIVLCTTMDEAALPWNGDWYNQTVRGHLGARVDDSFRLWYVDNSLHSPQVNGHHNARIVDYTGALQQALRDVSAWVENGTAPLANTNYELVDGQVVIPQTAAQRRGIQPVVDLRVNGAKRADVRVGETVRLSGAVEVPRGAGRVVWADWDFDGEGAYPERGQVRRSGSRATVATTHAFTRPGTYFVALRVAAQRRPDGTDYAQVRNLDRVRVVVS